jgi:hypothetical protein
LGNPHFGHFTLPHLFGKIENKFVKFFVGKLFKIFSLNSCVVGGVVVVRHVNIARCDSLLGSSKNILCCCNSIQLSPLLAFFSSSRASCCFAVYIIFETSHKLAGFRSRELLSLASVCKDLFLSLNDHIAGSLFFTCNVSSVDVNLFFPLLTSYYLRTLKI